ncbi:uncharacterized protein LOC125235599 [Leguminivora glycinivorella]|uniref:uncharacterized protein LOC125235599 n=1 Tax=Leguminivora glycinivorella TaxID=1035111 RepID=UPI00200EF5C4|nr:uncharacterized protein LOC125235599 [Leguminivora glycinivorella]
MANDDIKDRFYEELELVYDLIPEYDAKIVLGDFNAKIGQEEIFTPTIGRHSKHKESNGNGIRLVSFATLKSLVVKSTMFPHKNIYKGTWKSPDGVTVNQIDHVLVDNRHKAVIEDVRSFRGADVDSDHYMLGIKIKAKIKAIRKTDRPGQPVMNTENLKDEAVRRTFQLELHNRFNGLEAQDDVDEAWVEVRDIVKEVGLKVIGKRGSCKKRKWWSKECDMAMEEKRRLRALSLQDHKWEIEYTEKRNFLRNLIRQCKRKHLEDQLSQVETLMRSNASRKFYQEVRAVKKGYQPTVQFLEDDAGNLISDPSEMRNEWRRYFEGLLNCPPVETDINVPEDTSHSTQTEIPTFEEVRKAIMRLKNNKCPGVDGIPAEIWKYGGGSAV